MNVASLSRDLPKGLTILKEFPNWVGGNLPDKEPLNPHTGNRAQSNNPKTWGSYEQALDAQNRHNWDLIGFCCRPETINLVFIDLDHCIEDGEIQPWAMNIIRAINSYSEISPSGEGIHILAYGYPPENIPALRPKDDDIALAGEPPKIPEIYHETRWFTITGNHVPDTPETIEDRPREVAALYGETKKQYDGYKKRLSEAKRRKNQRSGRNGSQPHYNGSDSTYNDLKAEILAAYDYDTLLRFAQTLYPGTTEPASHNGTRITGHGGLIIYPEPDLHWVNYSEGSESDPVGGDAFNLAAMHLWGNHKADGRDFHEAMIMAGKFVGIDVDARLKESRQAHNANGSEPTPIDDQAEPPPESGPFLGLDLILKSLGRSETGHAELMAELYRNKLVFDHSEKQWYSWDSKARQWRQDIDGHVRNLIPNEVAEQYLTAARIVNKSDEYAGEARENLVKALRKRAYELCERKTINNVIARAADQPAFAITHKAWNDDPYMFPAANGLINLRNGDFRETQPEDMIRTHSPVSWQGLTEPCPIFEKFLREILGGNQDYIKLLSYWLGYNMTGLTIVHKFIILCGPFGRNGKSTLLEILFHILGADLSGPVPKDTIIESFNKSGSKGAASPHLMLLRGKRMAWVSETKSREYLALGEMKYLSGGDTIRARDLYQNYVDFRPTHKLTLITNKRPRISDDDQASWDRIVLIPFDLRYVADPKKDNERKADELLLEKMKAEASGILAWLVRKAIRFLAEGLPLNDKVLAETAKYRKQQDITGRFVEERMKLDPLGKVTSRGLKDAYKDFCDIAGVEPKGSAFTEELLERWSEVKYKTVVRVDDIVTTGFTGIRFKTDHDKDEELKALADQEQQNKGKEM